MYIYCIVYMQRFVRGRRWLRLHKQQFYDVGCSSDCDKNKTADPKLFVHRLYAYCIKFIWHTGGDKFSLTAAPFRENCIQWAKCFLYQSAERKRRSEEHTVYNELFLNINVFMFIISVQQPCVALCWNIAKMKAEERDKELRHSIMKTLKRCCTVIREVVVCYFSAPSEKQR